LSEGLKAFLASRGVWHRFIEFEEPVKTVEQAARKVPVEKIAKSSSSWTMRESLCSRYFRPGAG